MPLIVTIRETPQRDGEPCAHFDNAAWWSALELVKDPRFRVWEPSLSCSTGCLTTEEMRDLQKRFRPGMLPGWKSESDRLDEHLAKDGNRWWVVVTYEWESGID